MRKRSIFSIVALGVLLILSVFAFIMSKSMLKDADIVEQDTVGDERVTIKELIITETKDGKKFWELYAESGRYDNGTNLANLTNIKGNFYSEEGKVVLSVMSPKATFDNIKKEIKLHGGAEAANNREVYIKADEIRWTGAKDRIKAKGNVKIIKEGELMTVSDESSFNTDFSDLKLSGNTNAYVFSGIYGNLKK